MVYACVAYWYFGTGDDPPSCLGARLVGFFLRLDYLSDNLAFFFICYSLFSLGIFSTIIFIEFMNKLERILVHLLHHIYTLAQGM